MQQEHLVLVVLQNLVQYYVTLHYFLFRHCPIEKHNINKLYNFIYEYFILLLED